MESAREKLLASVGNRLVREETVSLAEALGRIAARDIFAVEDIPAFRRSTVDGYAVLSKDTAAAGENVPVFLTLKGRVEMGCPADISIASGSCVEVPTGGTVPQGADAMAMVEYTEPFGPDGIALSQSVAYGENIVQPGEDAKPGDLLLRRGKQILPQDIGALAAAGITSVPVCALVRAAILSTGDELVPPEKNPGPGQIRDINSHALAALARKHGLTVTSTQVLPDDETLMEKAVRSAMESNDIVIVSGGSSKGKKDITRIVFDRLCAPGVFTHGIALKPGKPTILGYDEASRTLLAGLPGHPVSAMMVFELLIGWLLREVMGTAPPPAVPAKLTGNIASSPGKLTCWPCRLILTGESYQADPVFGKSGLITTLTQADGYFIAPREAEGLLSGQTVMVHLF